MIANPWNKRPRRIAAATLPMAIALSLAACQSTSVREPVQPRQDPLRQPAQPGPSSGEPSAPLSREPIGPLADGIVRVAILLPLSGPDSGIGKAMLDAAQMAVFDIADDRFRLMPFDTAGKSEVARAAAEKALAENVRLILGPLFSTSVAEVAPLGRAAGVNVIAFSNNRAVAGDGSYLIGLLPSEQVRRVVAYAGAQGLRRFAALVPETPFGQQVAMDLRRAVAPFGGVVTRVETYPPEVQDLSEAVRQLGDFQARRAALLRRKKELEGRRDAASRRELRALENRETMGDVAYDAILLPQHGSRLKSIAAMMPFYDIDTAKVRLLGMASWDQSDLGSEPPLVGAWYPAPQIDARREFNRRFSDMYGYGAPVLATLAYDATALAAVLGRGENGPDFSAAAITSASGFAGTGGVFRFLPNGHSQRQLAIMEVRPDRVRVLDPAPRSFADLTN